MLYLNNGCSCSEPNITPSNWDSSAKSIKKRWAIHYRFYDPLQRGAHPKGKLVQFSANLNRIKNYEDRKQAAKDLLKSELHLLKKMDYNPITKQMKEEPAEAQDHVIDPETGLNDALSAAYKRMKHEPSTLKDVRSVMKYCKISAVKLRLDCKPVKEISRRHIILVLDQCKLDKPNWTNKTYNWYRANLLMLFNELEKVEAVTSNPVEKVEILKAPANKRAVLSMEQRIVIDTYLRSVNYKFWRFIHIFFHSGSRETEILRVQGKDVNLNRQEVTYTVKKGREWRQVQRPIKDSVLHLWIEAMGGCKPDQYVFSEDLQPGANSIRPEQITRRWRRWVKVPLSITEDFYSLKHLNTTEMSAQVGTALTAKLNAHSEEVLIKHYDVEGAQRELDRLKKVGNAFA